MDNQDDPAALDVIGALIGRQLLEEKSIGAKLDRDRATGVAEFVQYAYGYFMRYTFPQKFGPCTRLYPLATIVSFDRRYGKANEALMALDGLEACRQAYSRVGVRFIYLSLHPIFQNPATTAQYRRTDIADAEWALVYRSLHRLHNLCSVWLSGIQVSSQDLEAAVTVLRECEQNYRNMQLAYYASGFLKWCLFGNKHMFKPGQDFLVEQVLTQIGNLPDFCNWPMPVPGDPTLPVRIATDVEWNKHIAESFLRALEEEAK